MGRNGVIRRFHLATAKHSLGVRDRILKRSKRDWIARIRSDQIRKIEAVRFEKGIGD
jgi:hypothetical protein